MKNGRGGFRPKTCSVESLKNNSVKTGDLICRGFLRISDAELPEQRLWLAVLCGAVMDLMMGERKSHEDSLRVENLRKQAIVWFREGHYVFACDMAGLDPDFVMDVLREHAGLN